MKLANPACRSFEQDISLFVDHELPSDETRRLVAHLDGCSACRDYLSDLRGLAAVHRAVIDQPAADAALAAVVDKHELFASITRTLIEEKRDELARLFYELGKAYVLAGNRALTDRNHRLVESVKRPVDIRSAVAQGRRVAREAEQLCAARREDGHAESGSLFRRSRRLFSSSARAGSGALANGQRLLREALALRPGFDEARLYLGFHHLAAGRQDRARLEFRRVYRTSRDPVHRMMALQFLGNVYSSTGDYRRAIECYEQVVSSELDQPQLELHFLHSLLNLAVSCAKAGLVGRCVQAFSDLVSRFPSRTEQARQLLGTKQNFVALLQRESDLRETLCRRVPALFTG
jgi:tetratricopeptide (TPR) repeat protein